MERMIREKEAKIVESERVAKDLMLKAEEFEDMFIGKMTQSLIAHESYILVLRSIQIRYRYRIKGWPWVA